MKKALFIIACFLLLLGASGCRTTRTTQTDSKQETKLNRTTEEHSQQDNDLTAVTTTNKKTDERRNIVIEFTRIEYNEPQEDSTTDTSGTAASSNQRDKESRSKPPDTGRVKTTTTGKITINGDKTEATEINTKTELEATGDSTKKETVNLEQEDEASTKEKKEPGISPFYWVLLGTVLAGALFIGIKLGRK